MILGGLVYKVCIDPGHPSEVGVGTRGKKLTELHANWIIALKLKDALSARKVKVILTKRTEKQHVRNRARAEIANRFHADLMVRLHCDSSTDGGYAIYSPFKAGSAEGHKGPSSQVISQSKHLGPLFHAAFKSSMGEQLKDNGFLPDTNTAVGAKHGALIGSVFSKVPVVLVEMVTLTNKSDEAFLSSPKGQKKMVDALVAGTLAALASKSRR